MGEEPYDYARELRRLLNKPENKVCVDCPNQNPQWAAVHHGCFMCIECSGIQRSLGVYYTFVRSATLDDWTPTQVKFMEMGGNRRAREYFKKHGLDRLPVEQKYKHPAAMAYKKLLKDAVESGHPLNIGPALPNTPVHRPSASAGEGRATNGGSSVSALSPVEPVDFATSVTPPPVHTTASFDGDSDAHIHRVASAPDRSYMRSSSLSASSDSLDGQLFVPPAQSSENGGASSPHTPSTPVSVMGGVGKRGKRGKRGLGATKVDKHEVVRSDGPLQSASPATSTSSPSTLSGHRFFADVPASVTPSSVSSSSSSSGNADVVRKFSGARAISSDMFWDRGDSEKQCEDASPPRRREASSPSDISVGDVVSQLARSAKEDLQVFGSYVKAGSKKVGSAVLDWFQDLTS